MRVVAGYALMCAIWASTWIAIKTGLAYLPPVTGVGFRFVIAGCFLFALAGWRGALRPPSAWPWKLILALAVLLFAINHLLMYVATSKLDSGLAAILYGVQPFFMLALGGAMAGDRSSVANWLGSLVAFGGLALLSLTHEVQAWPLYAGSALVAAIAASIANLYAKRHAGVDPLLSLPPAMLIAGLVMSALGLALERIDWTAAREPASLAIVGYLAIAGAIAFFINLWLLEKIAAWKVGLSAVIVPALAVAIGIAIGGESFNAREGAGAALVLLGVWVALRPAARQTA